VANLATTCNCMRCGRLRGVMRLVSLITCMAFHRLSGASSHLLLKGVFV